MIQFRYLSSPALVCTLLAGCLATPELPGESPPAISAIADELEALLDTSSTEPDHPEDTEHAFPEPIRIPRAAPWLGDIAASSYLTDPVSAIEELLPGRAIRWDLAHPIPDIAVLAPGGPRTIAEHLDHIAQQADWAWFFENGSIIVTDMETRNYAIAAIPGSQDASIPMRALEQSDSSAGSGGGAGAEQPENNFEIELDAWRDLSDLLTQTIGIPRPNRIPQDLFEPPAPIGTTSAESSFTMTPAGNFVTVTAPPSIQREVERAIDRFNAGLNARALLTITVYELEFADDNQRSVDFNVLRDAATAADLEITGPDFDLSSNGISFTLTSLEGNEYDASSLLFRLLEAQAQTTVRLHERFETVNNIPISISDRRVLPYVAEISTGNQIGGGLSSLTPDVQTRVLSTGLALNVVSSIARDTVNVRLGYSQAELVRLDTYQFGSGPSAISGTLPVTDASDRLFRMSLRSGDTRLIANTTATRIANESANNAFGLLGGSRANGRSQRQTVIAVTVQIL